MPNVDLSKLITTEAKAAQAAAALKSAYEGAIQRHVDTTARSRNYAAGFTLAGYAGSTVPAWAAEAQAFIAWRDQVWVYAYAELAKVEAEERAAPESPDAFIAELPAIEWPEEEE